jgi:hypothetical protein
MKFPAFLPWTASVLLTGAARLHAADPTEIHATPPVRDLNLPAVATSDQAPDRTQQVPELKLTAQFDPNGDHRLDAAERQAARAYLAQHPPADPAPLPGRPAPIPPPAVALEPVKPGEKISPNGVEVFGAQPLYDARVLRTLFLEFEDTDWQKELADFARTDVLVPARLTLDGKTYAGVGVHFHSGLAVPSFSFGYKRSLDLVLDHTIAGQSLGSQRELRLLDSRTDPTFLRTLLYSRVARDYGPAPRTGFVRVVINGENWGVYLSVQPFDENFVQDYFHTAAGARWTVHPGGNLAYLGDNPDAYRRIYQLQSPEDPAAWAALIQLCKILNQTAPDELRAALAPHLDLDSTLMFLALENTLINQDGYGSNTGTYGLYLDHDGRFHLIPQDAEASFRLMQVSEYGERPPDRAGKGSGREGKGPEPADPVPKGYNTKDFPHQTGTDLAMLLSYSFIYKADTDLDGKVTKEEWLAFARAWFMAMDEDFTGRLTRQQFMSKVRLLITPPSIADGRTKQTFGRDDPAGVIGQDFFAAMDANHDGQLTPEELTNVFAGWFAAWSDPKTGRLTQDMLQRGFTALFSRSVFQADQSFIAKHDTPHQGGEDEHAGGRGRRGGGGNSVGVGPLRFLGLGGRGGKGDGSRSLITFSEELDPLAGLDDTTKPLLTKLLAEPALRAHYLGFMRDITENWLTWAKLGPIAKDYHDLIAAEVAKDTHKPASYEHFVQELDQDTTPGARDGDEAPSLKNFIIERSAYLRKDDMLTGGN